jgi:ribosome-associated translation inhibitor RaiA
MQVQVTTDNHIPGSAELTASVREALLAALDRFQPQLTRVDAHLRDQNSRQKRGQDIACTLEARLSGLAPVAATATGDTVQQAVHAATEKLVALLSRRLGRLADRRPDTSPSGDATD